MERIIVLTLLLCAQSTKAFYDSDSPHYAVETKDDCEGSLTATPFDATAANIVFDEIFLEDHTCVDVNRTIGDANYTRQICWRKKAGFDSGDVAWMLCATTFVMLQTPAAGFAQSGLVQRKNAMSVIGQAFIGVVIGCVLWFAFGYSLTFGGSCDYDGCGGDRKGFIGDISAHYFMHGVTSYSCENTIPTLLFAAFQMTFALMVPVLVTGAWAEKFSHKAAILFMVIWPILVYYPSAHWVWGGGYMSGWGKHGVLDYAGGIVIHTSSGVASFVVAKMVERRKSFQKTVDTTHNLPLSMVGVALIWVGWFSFNGGSGLRANGQAIGALFVTQVSSCFAAIAWAIMSYIEDGKIQTTHIASGALCGLAGITPGSGYVMPYAGIPIGLLTGLAGWFGGKLVKELVQLDDVLDVTSLQAFPGAVGSILVGFFAVTNALPCDGPMWPGKSCGRDNNKGYGVFHGGDGSLLGYQIAAVVIMILWSSFFTFVTMIIIRFTVGINISAEDEANGLDLAFTGEKAYDITHDKGADKEERITRLMNAVANGRNEEIREIATSGVHPKNVVDVDGRTALHLAAKAGNLQTVQLLIDEYNMDLNVKDSRNSSPLDEAIKSGNKELIDYLKDKGATNNKGEEESIKFRSAAAKGDVARVFRHIQNGVDVNSSDYDERTALHFAATYGKLDCVKALLGKNALTNKKDRWNRTALQSAESRGYTDISRLLRSYDEDKNSVNLEVMWKPQPPPNTASIESTNTGVSELLAAGKEGNIAELKRLKTKGSNLFDSDYDGRTALHLAAFQCHVDTIKWLLAQKGSDANVKDHEGATPLAEAVRGALLMIKEPHEYQAVIQYFREQGGTMNVEAEELCNFAQFGKVDHLKLYSQAGVHLGLSDNDGRTAMHIAATKGRYNVVDILLENNVDINAEDNFGGTPLDDAINSRQESQFREYLIQKGARTSQQTNTSTTNQRNVNVTQI